MIDTGSRPGLVFFKIDTIFMKPTVHRNRVGMDGMESASAVSTNKKQKSQSAVQSGN